MPNNIVFDDIDAGYMQVVPQLTTPESISGNTAAAKIINLTFSNIKCNNAYSADEYISFNIPNSSTSNIGWNYNFHNVNGIYPRLLTMKSVTISISGSETIFCGVKLQAMDTSVMDGGTLSLKDCKIYRGRWEEGSNSSSIKQARDGRFRVSVVNCELLSSFSMGIDAIKLSGTIVALVNRSYGNYANRNYVLASDIVVDGTARQLTQDYKIGIYAPIN